MNKDSHQSPGWQSGIQCTSKILSRWYKCVALASGGISSHTPLHREASRDITLWPLISQIPKKQAFSVDPSSLQPPLRLIRAEWFRSIWVLYWTDYVGEGGGLMNGTTKDIFTDLVGRHTAPHKVWLHFEAEDDRSLVRMIAVNELGSGRGVPLSYSKAVCTGWHVGGRDWNTSWQYPKHHDSWCGGKGYILFLVFHSYILISISQEGRERVFSAFSTNPV
jgi:hypothetical protein